MTQGKSGVDAQHASAWDPQVVVGTSIGAVNGAAIAQGLSAAELEKFWLSLNEEDVQGLPPGMRGLGRWMARKIFGEIMDARLPQVRPEMATSSVPQTFWPPLPGVTPPTILVPYSAQVLAWKVPSLPVRPWTMTLVFSLMSTLMKLALSFQLSAFSSSASRLLSFPWNNPTVFPSGSANQAKVPPGMSTGGTNVLPPRPSARFSAACTSSTST